MKKNYTKRLENLRLRRSDATIQKAYLSESFNKSTHGESVKYALESMQPIDAGYTKNTYVAAEKIQKHITEGLAKKNQSVEFRYQGSVTTNTHIKLHSDVDVLVFTDKYYSVEPPLTVTSPYSGEPLNDLRDLRKDCFDILNGVYNQVDNSSAKSIAVYPTDPKRKVDVVPCNWLRTTESQNTSVEAYKGVQIYNKDNHTRSKDFPFLNALRIKEKDALVGGNFCKLVRVLKTLKADAEYEIKLSSFEIQSAIYGIDNSLLNKSAYQQLMLLDEGRKQLNKLITDKAYRESLRSPNGKELVFGNDESKVVELKKLHLEVDELVQDITEELKKGARKIDESLTY